ncbi:MAG: hypothetical protein DCC75_14075, partial [Proteobacteria bacterium]
MTTMLNKAVSYVNEAWLPVNQAVLDHTLKSLCDGAYDQDRSLLARDLQKDLSLFLFAVRKLSELVRNNQEQLIESVDPAQVFEQVSIDQIKAVLSVPKGIISQHRLDQVDEVKAERLSNSLISAEVAGTLAAKQGIDNGLAYATATFRQLGLTLVCWNYPHVYKRAVSNLQAGQTLEQVLSRMLGFSPTILGINIAKQWNICPEIRMAMGEELSPLEISDKAATLARSLERVCEVGEALARATHPEIYPSAKLDWKEAAFEIQRVLGKEGFGQLQRSLQSTLKTYLEIAPSAFNLPEFPEEEAADDSLHGRRLLANNRYVRHCPPAVQESFARLYAKLRAETIVKQNVDTLLKDIVPPLGFTRGCVYLVDPTNLSLEPRLAIGASKLVDYSAVTYNTIGHNGEPIVAAFRSSTPIQKEEFSPQAQMADFIAAGLGT